MRHNVNKRKSARRFNKSSRKTHPMNRAIMRGGFRL